MKDIFSKRLKSARTRAALSQDQLVARIGGLVSKNAISKYEKGEMMADSTVLLALAKALNVKADYFFRPYTVNIENVEFRKKSKLQVKNVNAIKQKVSDFVERYLEIEQFLNIESAFENPVADLQITSKEDVEKAANKVRTTWKLGFNAISNVIDVLEDKEIKVVEIEAPDEFDGFSGWADKKIPVIVINKGYTVERKRLTAFHELGHLLLNLPDSLSGREKERFCFQFAGAMLIPQSTFLQETGKHRSHFSQPELIAIMETYGISVQAIMARAKDLDVINESQFISFRKWISRNLSEEGLGAFRGLEQPFRFKQLIYRAAAEEIISLSKAANLSNLKLAEFRKEFVAL
jgi:Zn-dependent peptidase ImmA (M78 family)/transcriptional regulator with XRE-family HTH domain